MWSKVLPGDSSVPANHVQDTNGRSSGCFERTVRGLLRECDEFQVVLVAAGRIRYSLAMYEEGARVIISRGVVRMVHNVYETEFLMDVRLIKIF